MRNVKKKKSLKEADIANSMIVMDTFLHLHSNVIITGDDVLILLVMIVHNDVIITSAPWLITGKSFSYW